MRHLSVLQRQNVIALWNDHVTDPGQKWKNEIDRNLEQAQVVLLLVSADFLASDYCWGIEMKRALERHESGQALVIPVILRPVDWTEAPFGKLQALPEDAKPVTSWANQDEAFANIAMGIRKAVAALATRQRLASSVGARYLTRLDLDSSHEDSQNDSSVQITFAESDAISFKSDVLILKYAQAFHGLDRVIAHKLATSGDLSPFSVPLGEYRLVSSEGVLGAKSVLFIGVQPLIYLDYAAIERFADRGLEVLETERPGVEEISLTLHGPGYGLDEREATLAILRGLVSAIERRACPPKLERIAVVERDGKRLARILGYLKGVSQSDLGESAEQVSNNTFRVMMRSLPMVTPQVGAGRGSLIRPSLPSAFVAMPFGDEFADVYHYGIQTAVHSAGLLCERVDAVAFTGDVVERIKTSIEAADLVVADLTGSNPNVYLEVGYAWGCRRPTVLVVRDADALTFDVRGQRCLVYKTIHQLEELLTAEIAALRTSGTVLKDRSSI